MKILAVVGKIDSRMLVYPLMRALSMSGLTGVITDDGAYRRLYPGKELIGSVSGVDIGVCSRVNEENLGMLKATGLDYDYLIVVSSDYLPENADGIIVCHGLDRTVVGVSQEEEEDDFILPYMENEKKEAEAKNKEDDSKKSKAKKGKAQKSDETADDGKKESEATDNSKVEDEVKTSEPIVETEHEKMLRLQEENPDKIMIPQDKPFTEVQIAYAAAPKKSNILAISIKDGLTNYVYTAEEQKKIGIIQDKALNSVIVKAAAKPLGLEDKELMLLMSKEEGLSAPVKQSKKKK